MKTYLFLTYFNLSFVQNLLSIYNLFFLMKDILYKQKI